MAVRIHVVCVIFFNLYYYVQATANTTVTVLATDQNKGDTRGFIFKIDIASEEVSKMNLFKNLKPTAISYDHLSDTMYWSDVMSKQIRSAKLDGSNETVVIDLPSDSVIEGITIDTKEKLLFYTDKGRHKVVKVSLNSKNKSDREFEIASRSVEKPRGITVYPKKKRVIWTDWKAWAAIEICDYDAKNRRELINTDISWPNDVTLDEKTEILYWCDANPHKRCIESVKLDGTERRIILKDDSSHFYGIKLFEDVLYLTDWNTKYVHLYFINGTRKNEGINVDFVRPSGLFVLRRSTCKDGHFGSDCRLCGKCKDDRPCIKLLGHCTNGCSSGYYGLSCNDRCLCEPLNQENYTPGCDNWRYQHCPTTTTTTTTTTTETATTGTTTTHSSTTIASITKSQTTIRELLRTDKHSFMVAGKADSESKFLDDDKNIPMSVTTEDAESLQSSNSASIGVSASFCCIFFITTLIAVFFASRYRKRIRQLSKSHSDYLRTVSVATEVTHSSPTNSEDSDEKKSQVITMTSTMLDSNGHPKTDYDNMSEDGLADVHYETLLCEDEDEHETRDGGSSW